MLQKEAADRDLVVAGSILEEASDLGEERRSMEPPRAVFTCQTDGSCAAEDAVEGR